MPINDNNPEPQAIALGYPLDLLLDRDNYLKPGTPPSVLLPSDLKPGIGNLVIRGRPGTGKSTLAMQMAVACCLQAKHKFSAAYFALEEQPAYVSSRSSLFGWSHLIKPLCHLHNISKTADPVKLAEALMDIFRQPDNCSMIARRQSQHSNCSSRSHKKVNEITPFVLLPSLSPRDITMSEEANTDLFWKRFHQIENLLLASEYLRKRTIGSKEQQIPDIRVVCIDSLNVFGNKLLTREEIFRLFDLFKRYQTIGIFVVEEDERQTASPDSRLHGDMIEYLADVVISLTSDIEQGYFLRYLEIVKSRYQHQVYGRHPFKIAHGKTTDKAKVSENKKNLSLNNLGRKSGILIYPSLHYVVYSTERSGDTKNEGPFDFCIAGMKNVLPVGFYRPANVLLEGPRGAFKTTIARNFLLAGLVEGESALYIRFHNNITFNPGIKRRISRELSIKLKWENFSKNETSLDLGRISKIRCQLHTYLNNIEDINTSSVLVEVAFKSGMLLPEEFIEIVKQVLDKVKRNPKFHPIKRVVLDDVSLIGVSYPLLRSSTTAGELFLTAFAHIMRNEQVSLVFTGSRGECVESDAIVNKTRVLSDTVLTCQLYDIFGDRYVTITGEGLLSGKRQTMSKQLPVGKTSEYFEYVPGVLFPENIPQEGSNRELFYLDLRCLEGLVGFTRGKVVRPGIIFRTFQENREIHKNYNNAVRDILLAAFGRDRVGKSRNRTDLDPTSVDVVEFDSRRTRAIHDSYDILGGKQIDRTIVATVDEFWMGHQEDPVTLKKRTPKDVFITLTNVELKKYIDTFYRSDDIYALPYYSNLLVLAVRRFPFSQRTTDKKAAGLISSQLLAASLSKIKNMRSERCYSWSSILSFTKEFYNDFRKELSNVAIQAVPFSFDRSAHETLSCIIMDAIVSAAELSGEAKFEEIELLIKAEEVEKINKQRGRNVLKLLRSINVSADNMWQESANLNSEIDAIQELMEMDTQRIQLKKGSEVSVKKLSRDRLHPNAGVYLCWYTQLRNLIYTNPYLAEQLDVYALPGRGFSGDWFIGIVKGSVSSVLGSQVINTLTTYREEYKRFVAGVGLPVSRKFYYSNDNKPTSYYAWPRSRYVKLHKLHQIHSNALTRQSIHGYVSFRPAIYTMCKQFIRNSKTRIGKDELLQKIYSSLSEQINILLDE